MTCTMNTNSKSDEYIVQSTMNDVLAEEDGEASAGHPISKNDELAIDDDESKRKEYSY